MFGRLKVWLVDWATRYQRREIERLRTGSCRLKETLFKLDGGKPTRLSAQEECLLAEKAKGIDPKILKQLAVIGFEPPDQHSVDDTSAEYP